MKSVLSTLALGALLVMSSAALAAGGPPDPVVGTWKLNTAKSSGANVPKSETRTYTASAAGLTIHYQRVTADGKEISVQATYKPDAKDYPVTGSPAYDSVNVKRIASKTVEITQKLKGKVVGTTMRSLSRDGRTLTLSGRAADAKGQMTTTTLVFDRQ
jgi:hypothetical protein